MVFLVTRKAQETVEHWTVLCQFPYILKSYFGLESNLIYVPALKLAKFFKISNLKVV